MTLAILLTYIADKMINIIFYIITSGIINGTRGMNIISRTTFLLFHGLFSFVMFNDIYLSLIIMAGVWGWLSKGWGVYFNSFDPQPRLFKDRYDRSVKFIHKICDHFIVVNLEPFDYKACRNWATLGMALRGFIFSIPLFIMLALYLHNPWIVLLSIPMLLQGLFYRFINKLYIFRKAEFLTAGLLSTLISISLCL